MKINPEAFASIEISDLIEAIAPLRVTHNFLQMMITVHGELEQLARGDLVPDLHDAAALQRFVERMGDGAACLIPNDKLTTELEALNSVALVYDMRENFALYLMSHERLDIGKNLQITLTATYAAMLAKVIWAVADMGVPR
jgi:hypothetical protein